LAVLLLLWPVAALYKGTRNEHSTEGASYMAAFIVIAVASQFSGDLYDSRALFVLPLLALRSRACSSPLTRSQRRVNTVSMSRSLV
jgi:hypothetical protein